MTSLLLIVLLTARELFGMMIAFIQILLVFMMTTPQTEWALYGAIGKAGISLSMS